MKLRLLALAAVALALTPATARADSISYPSQQPAPDVVNEITYEVAGWAYKIAPAAIKPCEWGTEQWMTSLEDLRGTDVPTDNPADGGRGWAWGRGWRADDGSQCAMWVSDDLVSRLRINLDGSAPDDLLNACTAVAHEWLHSKGIPHEPVGVPAAIYRVMSAPKRAGSNAPEPCLRWTYEQTVKAFRKSGAPMRYVRYWLPAVVRIYARAHIASASRLLPGGTH